MKVTVTLKDPDGFYESVDEAVKESLASYALPEDEQEVISEARRKKTWEALSKWVEYHEYVTIEFDTEAGTATVTPK